MMISSIIIISTIFMILLIVHRLENDFKKLKDNCEFWKNAYFKIKGDV